MAARMLEENKHLHHRLKPLEEIASRAEAERLYSEAEPNTTGVRVISMVYEHRDAESLRMIAQSLVSQPKVVALLGSSDADTARIVFARSPDASGDMNALMKTACTLLDGRGGGKPELAQGGGKNVDKLYDALRAAVTSL
jgi:alanyl-tRNA synthetase